MTIRLSDTLKKALLGSSGLDAVWTTGDAFYIKIFSGTQPDYPEYTATGTCLATITSVQFGSAAFSSTYNNVVLPKTGTWADTSADATGTAGWFRIYDPDKDSDDGVTLDSGWAAATGGTKYYRIDGSIGETAAYDMVVSDAYIISGQSFTIDTFNMIIY